MLLWLEIIMIRKYILLWLEVYNNVYNNCL